MAYFKIEVDPKLLQANEWTAFTPPFDAKYPRMYRISDGNAKIYFNATTNYYILGAPLSDIKVFEDKPEEIKAAPNPQFSESFILKLVAIANDSKLAKDLT